MIGLEFSYDGRDSSEFGLYIVRMESGLITTPYAPSVNILEEHPKKVLTPYYLGCQYQPLTFNVTLAVLEDGMFDSDKLYEIGSWLFQNTYKPFISEDNLGKIYYCMAINKADFMTDGLRNGHFTVEFRCKDAFAWTNTISSTFDLSDNIGATPTTIEIENLSNIGEPYYYPIFEFELQSSATGVSISNTSDGGRTCTFSSLDTSETIYVDNLKKIIISSTNNYRFDKWNNVWFRLVKGINYINVTGKCIITFNAQYPIIS